VENVVVLVTCGSAKEAHQLGRALVRKRLAACANMVTNPVKSIYWWKGKVETATESLMLIKTTRRKFGALEKEIRRLHSYETPEIIALPIVAGSKAYLGWLGESVKGMITPQRARGRGRR
jgi:periplasmic divalent cation tolerance protein